MFQYKLICVEENGAATNPVTAAVGELDNVRKFPSGLNPVPDELTAYPAKKYCVCGNKLLRV
jgi:hypothetical protein